jgi:hypothetical protein
VASRVSIASARLRALTPKAMAAMMAIGNAKPISKPSPINPSTSPPRRDNDTLAQINHKLPDAKGASF